MLTERLFNVAQGGAEFILWLLLGVSAISVALIIERAITLWLIGRKSNRARALMQEALVTHHLESLEDLSRDRESIEGRALYHGLRYAKECGESGLYEVMKSFALLEKPNLERYLNVLATIGSNAPFVGLLGTVLGIMKAFKDLSANAGSGNEAVMLGIAEALVSTAVGLVVAIPAVIAYNTFQRKVKRLIQSLETVTELCLAFAKQKGSSGGGRV